MIALCRYRYKQRGDNRGESDNVFRGVNSQLKARERYVRADSDYDRESDYDSRR